MARTEVPVADLEPTPASLTTNFSDPDADVTFTAQGGGQWGNDVDIAFVDPGGVSASPSVVVEGFLITVNLGRTASAIDTTASRILSLIQSSRDARALVSVTLEGDGTGLVEAFSAASLAGGAYGLEAPALVNGDATNGHYLSGNDGRVILEVVSSDASPRTVTIRRSAAFSPGLPLDDEVVTIPAGETWELGPFPPGQFNQNSSGDVYFDPEVSDTLDFRAKRVTRVL